MHTCSVWCAFIIPHTPVSRTPVETFMFNGTDDWRSPICVLIEIEIYNTAGTFASTLCSGNFLFLMTGSWILFKISHYQIQRRNRTWRLWWWSQLEVEAENTTRIQRMEDKIAPRHPTLHTEALKRHFSPECQQCWGWAMLCEVAINRHLFYFGSSMSHKFVEMTELYVIW